MDFPQLGQRPLEVSVSGVTAVGAAIPGGAEVDLQVGDLQSPRHYVHQCYQLTRH